MHLGRPQAMSAAIPSPRRRVCFVAASEMTVRTLLLAYLRAVPAHYDVTVVADSSNPRLLDELGVRARLVRIGIERQISPWRDLLALCALVRLFHRGRFDIVHSLTSKAGLLAMAAAWLGRVPVRIHTFCGQAWATREGASRAALRRLDTLLARLATVTLADSLAQRDFLVREGVTSASRLMVVGKGSINGVDPAVFKPDAALRRVVRERLQIAPTDVVVVFVGRFTREKGVLDLARAFALVAEERPDLRLQMVGPDEEGLQPAIVAACGAHLARVDIQPYTDRPHELMVAADVLCLPSYREGVGTVTIEASACGIPVIASRIYGLADAVVEGTTGLLHAPGDVHGLALLLGRVAADPELRRSLGAAGRDYAIREFHVDHRTAGLLALYAQVLEPAGPRHAGPPADHANGSWYSRRGKRMLDAGVAAVALVALAPLLALIGLIVRVTLGSPVLFAQRRPGWNGTPFTLLKFRTMTDRYDGRGQPLPDPERLTTVGRFLRATSLDELPELWNVLKGEMSLVGPRPLLMEYMPLYNTEQAKRHTVRPGLTGLAQVHGRNGLAWASRFALDVEYVGRHSFAMDVSILLRTMQQVLTARGITQADRATVDYFRGNTELNG
jgi:lipopolysaccharide/colanic/teichoic acid biosynthesis glycosyltransferase/glycosyltransferase involved in cell wall biosynthesis